jgi:hypothetical protein
MNQNEKSYDFSLQTLYCSSGESDNATITDIQPVMFMKYPLTRVPNKIKPLFRGSLGKNEY